MNKNQQPKHLQNLAMGAMFAALIVIAISVLRIPIPMTNGGYTHIGDAVVFLAACVLPGGYALIAAALGGGLADLIAGAPMWIIPTVLIKSFIVLFFSPNKKKLLCKRNLLALIPALLLTIGGYYFAEALMYANWLAPLAGVLGNFVQWVFSSVVFIAIGAAIDKSELKLR